MNAGVEQSGVVAAGHAALKRGDWEEARAIFEGALRESETPEALEGLGLAAWSLDDAPTVFETRERAYCLYRERGDSRSAARLATWLAWDYKVFRGDPAITNGWLQRAHRLLDDLDPCPEHVWLAIREGAFALDLDHDAERARELGTKAVKLAHVLGLPDWELVALSLEGLALVTQGQVVEGLARLDEVTVAAVAGELSDPSAVNLAWCHLIFGCERAAQ
jgi:LuxR family transcriptional regulator, maltose regulon positive regulatory protein